jgi:NADPH:quinone reductase-like Zn-dependent oxidoreductase
VPVPGAGELLVKNEYIGINYIDTFVFATHSLDCLRIFFTHH